MRRSVRGRRIQSVPSVLANALARLRPRIFESRYLPYLEISNDKASDTC